MLPMINRRRNETNSHDVFSKACAHVVLIIVPFFVSGTLLLSAGVATAQGPGVFALGLLRLTTLIVESILRKLRI